MTNQLWHAQIKIDERIVLEVLSKNVPDLVVSDLRFLGSGWDNSVWLVNQTWCFRFPKKSASAALLLNEIEILSLLGALPTAIPEPKFILKKPKGFEFPFYGHALIAGQSVDRSHLTLVDRDKLAVPLAQFLKSLHSTSLEDLSLNISDGTIERFNVELMLGRIEQGLKALSGKFDNSSIILKFVKKNLSNLKIPEDKVLAHGDLYARHILLDDEKKLCGVIDWGDSEILSPAVDLAIVYQLLTRESQQEFWSVYGEVSEEVKKIAKLRAIYSSATMAWYGSNVKDRFLVQEGLQGLVSFARHYV